MGRCRGSCRHLGHRNTRVQFGRALRHARSTGSQESERECGSGSRRHRAYRYELDEHPRTVAVYDHIGRELSADDESDRIRLRSMRHGADAVYCEAEPTVGACSRPGSVAPALAERVGRVRSDVRSGHGPAALIGDLPLDSGASVDPELPRPVGHSPRAGSVAPRQANAASAAAAVRARRAARRTERSR
jgi:hypothetical protein